MLIIENSTTVNIHFQAHNFCITFILFTSLSSDAETAVIVAFIKKDRVFSLISEYFQI
jgi:hypothetical protein